MIASCLVKSAWKIIGAARRPLYRQRSRRRGFSRSGHRFASAQVWRGRVLLRIRHARNSRHGKRGEIRKRVSEKNTPEQPRDRNRRRSRGRNGRRADQNIRRGATPRFRRKQAARKSGGRIHSGHRCAEIGVFLYFAQPHAGQRG